MADDTWVPPREVTVVVLDPTRPALLARRSGRLELPRLRFDGGVPSPDRRIPRELARVTGLDAVLLEPLDFGSHVMELLHPAAAPAGHAWVGLADVEAFGADFGQLAGWIGRRGGSRPAWFEPGWFARAAGWLDDTLAGLGLRRTGPVEQAKHWCLSSVLRAPTDRGAVFLKATMPRYAAEPAVVRALAERWPSRVPRVLAGSAADCWWLTADFGGASGFDLPEPERVGALDLLADLQLDPPEGQLVRLLARDQPTQPWSVLGRAELWGRAADWRSIGRELSPVEHERLAALGPWLARCRARLDESVIRPTLLHGDFHPGNVVHRAAEGFLIHDWSFARADHPFLDLTPWLHETTASAAPHHADAYLARWRDRASAAELAETWRLAGPLGAAAELAKAVELLDATGPDYDFSWLTVCFGWARRLLAAVDAAQA